MILLSRFFKYPHFLHTISICSILSLPKLTDHSTYYLPNNAFHYFAEHSRLMKLKKRAELARNFGLANIPACVESVFSKNDFFRTSDPNYYALLN